MSMNRKRIARPLIVCVISISCGFSGDFYVETGEMGYSPNSVAGDVLAVLEESLHVEHGDDVVANRRSHDDDRIVRVAVFHSGPVVRQEAFFRVDDAHVLA